MQHARKSGGWRWFALLCLIAGSRWVLEDQWPQVGSSLRSEAWACGVAALLVFARVADRRSKVPPLRSVLLLLAVGGGLLAAPLFGVALGGVAADAFDRSVALCFVPTIVTVLAGIWGENASTLSGLWPGLAGLGGALLIFPLVLPSNVLGYVTLLAPAIVVSAACVACRRAAREVAVEWSTALLLTGGAVGLAVLEWGRLARGGVSGPMFEVWAVAIDLLLAGLVVYVVLRMEPLRYVSRYFMVPLIILLEGLVVLREGVTPRVGVGLALLALASGALLRLRDEHGVTGGLGLD